MAWKTPEMNGFARFVFLQKAQEKNCRQSTPDSLKNVRCLSQTPLQRQYMCFRPSLAAPPLPANHSEVAARAVGCRRRLDQPINKRETITRTCWRVTDLSNRRRNKYLIDASMQQRWATSVEWADSQEGGLAVFIDP